MNNESFWVKVGWLGVFMVAGAIVTLDLGVIINGISVLLR